jgi:transcriptional regulator with XRE-family HTH domain
MPTHSRTPNRIDLHIGQQIRKRRQQMDMSQTILGSRLGITFQQIQKYEKGTNRIGGGRLMQIAELLGVDIKYFYDGAPSPATAGTDAGRLSIAGRRETAAQSHDGVALIEALAAIRPPKMRKALVTIARALATAS